MNSFSALAMAALSKFRLMRALSNNCRLGGWETLTLEGWKLGFDAFYPSTDLFCEKCERQKGLCDNMTSPRYPLCTHPDNNISRKVITVSSAAATGLLITVISILFFRRNISTTFHWKFRNGDQDIEAFLKNNGALVPKRYSYSGVKKMTSSFKEKLGKGGYGSVYKGKLPDSRLIAVNCLIHPKEMVKTLSMRLLVLVVPLMLMLSPF